MSTNPIRIFALSAGLIALAACARTEEASLVPPDDETYNSVERVRTPENDDLEQTIGEWRRTVEDEEPVVAFGPIGAQPLFSIRCEERRGLVLQRHGTVPVGDLPTMLVQVASDVRRLPVSTGDGAVPMLRASVAPSDELVGLLADAQGPITVRIGDAVPLILPADPALGDYVGACRSGELRRAGGSETAPAPAEAEAQPGNAAEAPSG